MSAITNPLGVLSTLQTAAGPLSFYSLPLFAEASSKPLSRLPKTILVLLEAALRNLHSPFVSEDDVLSIAGWASLSPGSTELPFFPARVVLQDFTGVPLLVDLAALREACAERGVDPERVNPLIACDLVIDHSVQVDFYASPDALLKNLEREFQRNRERYAFLKWGQKAFRNFRVVPPGTGIVHQVNLEYLSGVISIRDGVAYPDSVVGTDSHTTMINALGVAGWGVGGIEAEAVMLGQPLSLPLPRVTGVRLEGEMPKGVTATDLVLMLTERLRKLGVVNDFVEFFGPGMGALSLPDRATVANMAPEYGASMGYFPVDEETLAYLKLTGRGESCDLVERYCKEQGLWRHEAEEPLFSRVVDFDLQSVEISVAGPQRPQERMALSAVPTRWRHSPGGGFGKAARTTEQHCSAMEFEGGCTIPQPSVLPNEGGGGRNPFSLEDGAVVIAAITSCTNTSNPAVMIAAGLVARAARARGLQVRPWVKTSLAPGSRVVTDYLEASGLSSDLDALGFATVGYGCTTCIGNSGPLSAHITAAIEERNILCCSVLSGNRNFEGRIHPLVRANYLASPPLVVAYALAGNITVDLASEPLGVDLGGSPVYLQDLWPKEEEILRIAEEFVSPQMFVARYGNVFSGTEQWLAVEAPEGGLYQWDERSTYIRKPPFLEALPASAGAPSAIVGARCLGFFGDSVTTDHISPAGTIKPTGSAGLYLRHQGVEPSEFNSFGSRRGNHEVMLRGTFSNRRLQNRLVPGAEGGLTRWFAAGSAEGEVMSIYDAAMRYKEESVMLVILAGKDYGMGSSRDWAAKGSMLLGIRAVIASSFERIHRSNLVGMGILPLEFTEGESADSLGLTGRECYSIVLPELFQPGAILQAEAVDQQTGSQRQFTVRCRIDTPLEVAYYLEGGILPSVLRTLVV